LGISWISRGWCCHSLRQEEPRSNDDREFKVWSMGWRWDESGVAGREPSWESGQESVCCGARYKHQIPM
jgi:hypothetical protein